MAQERFAGPEHYTEFDPEKFIRDLQIQKDLADEPNTSRTDEAEAAGVDEE